MGAALAINLGGAALLALVARVVDHVWGARRPALSHALWLLVLVDLVVPPVLGVAVLPAPSTTPAAVSSGALASAAALSSAGAEGSASNVASSVVLTGALWIAGAAVVFGLSVRRGRRFGRSIARATPAGAGVRARVASLAAAIGMRDLPGVLVVPARVPPLLRRSRNQNELVLPAELLERLDGYELDAVIAHELAHAARRDPWVRRLELVVTGVMWWFPVTWWARRRLRRAEELCCDAIVVMALPEARRSYATALVKTMEFLAGHASPLPDTASGASVTRDLHERLTMILTERPRPRLSLVQKILLGAAALVVLLVFPTRAERPEEPGDPALEAEEASAHDAETREAKAALEREAHDLDAARRDIERRKIEISKRRSAADQRRLESMGALAGELAAAGEPAELEQVRREMDKVRHMAEMDRARLEVERELLAAERDIALPLGELELEREMLLGEGREEEALALEQSIRDMQRELERKHALGQERALALERAAAGEPASGVELKRRAIELEIERLAAELEWLREQEPDASGAQ